MRLFQFHCKTFDFRTVALTTLLLTLLGTYAAPPAAADTTDLITVTGELYDGTFLVDLTTGVDSDWTGPGTDFIDGTEGSFFLTESGEIWYFYVLDWLPDASGRFYESEPPDPKLHVWLYTASPVPEPNSLALLATALLAVAYLARKRFAGGSDPSTRAGSGLDPDPAA
jgi:PEP-CTERM motif-containing protein